MRRRAVKFLLTAFALLIGCYAVIYISFYLIVMSDPKQNPALSRYLAENRLRKVAALVQTRANDVLLLETGPEISLGGTMACAYGRITRQYGSRQSYSDVVADYVEAFESIGWEHYTDAWSDDNSERLTFYNPSDFEVWVGFHQDQPVNYETRYTIYIDSHDRRCGPPNFPTLAAESH